MRHAQPLAEPRLKLNYDRIARVNLIEPTRIPAVMGGVDVKTIGVNAED